MSSGIYRITNNVDGMVYIGQSKNLASRLAGHRSLLASRSHPNRRLQDAWNLHGREAFSFDVVMLIDDHRCLNSAEEGWFYLTKCCDPGRGYNVKGRAAGFVPKRRKSPWRDGSPVKLPSEEQIALAEAEPALHPQPQRFEYSGPRMWVGAAVHVRNA